MKRNTIIELAVILGIFTIGYFALAFTISKDFKGDYKEELYQNKISAIETQAAIYAEGKKELFEKENSIYLTVEELAKENAIISNEEGVVYNPRNNEENINDLKVKITLANDKVTATVLD